MLMDPLPHALQDILCPRSIPPNTSNRSDVDNLSSVNPDVDPPNPDSNCERIHTSAGGSTLDGDVFECPDEGSYLLEAENDIATRLLHELADSDDPPVRILRDFFIFDSRSFNAVSLSSLWELDAPCEAFGQAIADTDIGECDSPQLSSFDGVSFRTSTILSYSLDIHQEYVCRR